MTEASTGKDLLIAPHLLEAMGRQISPDLLQVIREDGFHFFLGSFISGINVGKYLFLYGQFLLAGRHGMNCPDVSDHGIEWLPQMIDRVVDGNLQAKIVEAGKFNVVYWPVFFEGLSYGA